METKNYLESKKGMTLTEVLPHEFDWSYSETKAWKFKDVKVSEAFDPFNGSPRWPGKHKNVCFWVKLENGYAVGWNENLSRGWSFPVIKLQKNKT